MSNYHKALHRTREKDVTSGGKGVTTSYAGVGHVGSGTLLEEVPAAAMVHYKKETESQKADNKPRSRAKLVTGGGQGVKVGAASGKGQVGLKKKK